MRTNPKQAQYEIRSGRSPIRQFAYKTLLEFLENSKEGDVFEVTGFPTMGSRDKICMADKVAHAIRAELFHLNKGSNARIDIEVFRRRERLFIKRKEPHIAASINRKSNPCLGDFSKVY